MQNFKREQSMKMCISIKNLCFEAIIGILPEEKVRPQRVKIYAKIKYHYKDSKYLDYVSVVNCIVECVRKSQYDLLETALQDIAKHCFLTFTDIEEIKLYIEKPDIFTQCKVGMKAKFSSNEFQNHLYL